MGIMAPFCRILCRCEKIGSIYFTCAWMQKILEGKRMIHILRRRARTGVFQPGRGFCGSCFILLWQFGFLQAKSWPQELGEDSWSRGSLQCQGELSLGWDRPAHLLQLHGAGARWKLWKHALLHCLKSKLAAKAIIINPWEEMQSFWTSADCWNKPHPTKKPKVRPLKKNNKKVLFYVVAFAQPSPCSKCTKLQRVRRAAGA